MPERLQHIPEADDPGFVEMVEYFFLKACLLSEDILIDENMKAVRAPREEKVKKAHGILKIIEPCAHVLEVNFPLLRDDGTFLPTIEHNLTVIELAYEVMYTSYF